MIRLLLYPTISNKTDKEKASPYKQSIERRLWGQKGVFIERTVPLHLLTNVLADNYIIPRLAELRPLMMRYKSHLRSEAQDLMDRLAAKGLASPPPLLRYTPFQSDSRI
jgi:hypothetical protein